MAVPARSFRVVVLLFALCLSLGYVYAQTQGDLFDWWPFRTRAYTHGSKSPNYIFPPPFKASEYGPEAVTEPTESERLMEAKESARLRKELEEWKADYVKP